MAQTFLNLAQGVTGTLPTGNYVQGGGKVNQIIFAETTSGATQTGTSYADTNLVGSITPSATNSKIFVVITDHIFMCHTNSHDDQGAAFRVKRTIGGSNTTLYQNTSPYQGFYHSHRNGVSNLHFINNITLHYVDSSHNTTSAITYRHQIAAMRGNDNGRVQSANESQRAVMTLMEVTA